MEKGKLLVNDLPAAFDEKALAEAKYVNVQLITSDTGGVLREVTVLLGAGDDLYIKKIKDTIEAYMLDDSVRRVIEIQ